MNRKQKACLAVGFLLLVSAGLFPPWRDCSATYGFLLSPPCSGATLELRRLLVEWTLTALVTLALVYLFRTPPLSKPATDTKSAQRNRRPMLALSIALCVLVTALGITSFLLFRKIGRLEAGIQNAKELLDADSAQSGFIGPIPMRLPKGAVPVGLQPLGTVNGAVVYTAEQTHQIAEAEYDRVVNSMLKVVESKNETLRHVRELLHNTH